MREAANYSGVEVLQSARDTEPDTPGTLYYLYAVAQARGDAHELPEAGMLPDAPVQSIQHRELIAIVSPVPAAQFGPAALAGYLRESEWARERILSHQRVLSELLPRYALLPCAFCTLYTDADGIRTMLDTHAQALADGLAAVAGATEWGVKIFCSRPALIEWIATTAPELAADREAIARSSGGAGYLLRKRLAHAAEQLVPAIGQACVQASHERLGACARASAINPPQPPEVHGRAEEMALNAAYLVDDLDRHRLMAALDQLRASLGPRGFQLALTGPWPPYSFAALPATGGQP